MTLIKLCGLRSIEDIQIANALQPEYVGFVLVPQSRRYIDMTRLKALRQILSPKIKSVGVFANADFRGIQQYLEAELIDMVQLHGQEDELYIKNLRGFTDKPIIKAFGIKNRDDIYWAEQSNADLVLLDTCGGGTGKSFDWSLLKLCKRPYFLAGGLNSNNIKTAIMQYHPYGVDVSSGIEVNGSKDKNKAEIFVKSVRNT